MDLEVIAAVIVIVIAAITVIAAYGWRGAIKTFVFIGTVLLVYFVVITLFGQKGKVALAIVGTIFSVVFLFVRYRKGGSLWW